METVLHDWLILTGGSGKYEFVELKTYADTPVDKAFNKLHKRFLETDCEYAFIVNSDELPPMDALETLISHDKDVVSCVCFKWDTERGPLPVAARWSEKRDQFLYIFGAGLERIDRCGFSGTLIKRAVMEAVPVGTYRHEPTSCCECGYVDHLNSKAGQTCPSCGKTLVVDGTELISPEFIWLDMAREKGFEVWMDFGLRMHHYKNTDLLQFNDLMVEVRKTALENMRKKVAELREGGSEDYEIVDALLPEGIRNGDDGSL